MGQVIVDKWGWKQAQENIEKEMRITLMVQTWAVNDPPPVDIRLSPDMGFRCFIHIPPGTSEELKHKLLAWIVRKSGKKFERFFREKEGTVTFWNHEDRYFKEGAEKFEALFLIEEMALGKCRVIKKTKTVEVNELVCE